MTINDRYAELYAVHRWRVPRHFNIAHVCCRRWAGDESRLALICEDELGRVSRHSYTDLQLECDRVAHGLIGMGVERGDRAVIILPQSFEAVAALMACFHIGVIATPLSLLLGQDAIEYRLQDSGAVVAIAAGTGLEQVLAARGSCPDLREIVSVGATGEGLRAWEDLPGANPAICPCACTEPIEPAVLIYTSGTAGPPAGALIPHQALLGNLPGFVASQDGFPLDTDVVWSPADWAWTGGLWAALLPTLYFGRVQVGLRGRFSAERALRTMETYRVTNTFLSPTILRAIMKDYPRPREQFHLKLRALTTGGEAVSEAIFDWCRDALGVTPNEVFGQTEINYVVGNSSRFWPARPGSMGRPYPGHQVALLDQDGAPVPAGAEGEIAVNCHDVHGDPDPVFFLGYWRDVGATQRKYTASGDWCRTGDLAIRDEDGYLWYRGRADDAFKSAGYRIGPSEVENCLIRHPAVASAVVVPKPDFARGAVVKAFVVLAQGYRASLGMVEELQAHVRGRLADFESPREIEFVEDLPMTMTGKVQRRKLRELEAARAAANPPA
jgi:acetyl-CoA synthetase